MEKGNSSAIERRSLKIGPYQVIPVPTGEFGLDGGAMFGTVPKVLWEKSNPPDEKNRIPMEARALLLKSPSRCILIDCGNGTDFVAKYGEKLGTKFSQMYAVKEGGASLKSSLEKVGVKPEEITDVVLTHLHFDHCGGGVSDLGGGQLGPTFSKARYYVQKKNLDTALSPNIREKASYLSANFKPLIELGVLQVLEGDLDQVIPGVSVLVSNGHTRGHQMVKVSDGRQTLLYCGDVVPTSSHVRLAWVMGYDLEPLVLIEEKAKILSQAADENWYLFFEHDPYCDLAQVVKNGDDFSVKQRYHLDPV